MLRTTFLVTFVLMLVLRPVSNVGQAAPGTSADGTGPAFAPGQVLVRFKSDASLRTAASFLAPHGVTPMNRIADRTFRLAVPPGHEEPIVEALLADPAVQYASLNYRITETPISSWNQVVDDPTPRSDNSAGQEQPGCITNLWMSTMRQGEPLLGNMLPSDTPLVNTVFQYAGCNNEAVRVQVFYLGLDAAPQEIFDERGLSISGSGEISVEVQAWEYFTKKGVFPVGGYLTIVSVSPEGGWDEARSVQWRVSTFSNDHWFRGSSNYQWSLHSTGRRALTEADINMPQAWDITTGSPEHMIAIISTGANFDHPELKNKTWINYDEIPGNDIDDDKNGCVDDVHGCEFFNGESNPDPADPVGWGTFTSGIAAAETNNEIGMAGVSWGARVMPIKVLRLLPGNVLGGYLSDLIAAIEYAVSNGARILHIGPRVEDENVSAEKLQLLRAAIDEAVNQGALVIAGTGDLGEPRLLYPAGFENVLAVGATGFQGERTWFSNYGDGIDLVAPGELILTTCGAREYCLGTGTSLAAAHVGGVASLIWSVNPNLSPAEVRNILRESAAEVGSTGYDEEHGYGRLDAAKATARTPHHLWLHTPSLDRLALVFLLDDQVKQTCQTVWNRGTGPHTWTLTSLSDWLTVYRPSDSMNTTPVPSNAVVCVNTESLPEPGTFETMLEVSSTLNRSQEAVDVQVITQYQPNLPRVRLSLIQRP